MAQGVPLQLRDKLEVTIWRDESDEEGYTYPSSVRDMRDALILVDLPPSHSPAFDALRPGLVIAITANRPNGQLVVYPTIHSYTIQGNTGAWLRLPEDYEVLQRRRYVRIPFSSQLTISRENAADNPDNRPFVEPMVDLSAGGCRCLSAKKFTIDEKVNLQFQLERSDKALVQVQARVVYSFPYTAPVGVKQVAGLRVVAFEFTELDRQLEQRIIQLCFRLQLNRPHD